MKGRNLPHTAQAASGLLPAQLSRGSVPPANLSSSLSVHLPQQIHLPRGLATELSPEGWGPSWHGAGCHALAEHTQPRLETLPAHGSWAHLHHPQTGGSWGPSNSAKGHGQKLAAHVGLFWAVTCQDSRQGSLHVSKAPRNSEQLHSALP